MRDRGQIRAHFVDGPIAGRTETVPDYPEIVVAHMPPPREYVYASDGVYPKLIEFKELRYRRIGYRTDSGTEIFVYVP